MFHFNRSEETDRDKDRQTGREREGEGEWWISKARPAIVKTFYVIGLGRNERFHVRKGGDRVENREQVVGGLIVDGVDRS